MPMGFKRFRILNESGTDVVSTKYSAHADSWGDDQTIIVSETNTSNVPKGNFNNLAVPGGPDGLVGVYSIKTDVDLQGGANQIQNWLLAPSWEGYQIKEVELIVSQAAAFVRARIFLSDDYYEERIRFF